MEEWVKIIVQAALAVGLAIYEAVKAGDSGILDKRVRDILPAELRTTLEKKLADARAEDAFGLGSEDDPSEPPGAAELRSIAATLTRDQVRTLIAASSPGQRSVFADELRVAGVPENPYPDEP